jgi:hypothetical protein
MATTQLSKTLGCNQQRAAMGRDRCQGHFVISEQAGQGVERRFQEEVQKAKKYMTEKNIDKLRKIKTI